jgi:hypothetical protein
LAVGKNLVVPGAGTGAMAEVNVRSFLASNRHEGQKELSKPNATASRDCGKAREAGNT